HKYYLHDYSDTDPQKSPPNSDPRKHGYPVLSSPSGTARFLKLPRSIRPPGTGPRLRSPALSLSYTGFACPRRSEAPVLFFLPVSLPGRWQTAFQRKSRLRLSILFLLRLPVLSGLRSTLLPAVFEVPSPERTAGYDPGASALPGAG